MLMSHQKPKPGAVELLESRERQGTLFSLYFGLAVMALFIAVAVYSAQSTFELVVTLVIIGAAAAALVGLIILVAHGRAVGFAGWTLTLVYLAVILALPEIWYFSVGGDSVPKTFLLKINLMPLVFTCLVLTCLPGRPWYPLFYTLGSTLGLTALTLYALCDPSTVVAATILDSTLGPGANVGLVVNSLVLNLASGIFLAVFLARFRNTVVQAVDAEHSTAQLGRYFSPGLLPLISGSDSGFLKPGGQLQTVSIVFSDIRGFTSLSEGQPAWRAMASWPRLAPPRRPPMTPSEP